MTASDKAKVLADKASDGLPERIWITSYVASEYASVLARGLRFRSIHDSKEEAESMNRDPQAIGFTVSEYAKLPAPLLPVEEGLPLPCPFCGKNPKVGEQRGSDESGESYGYSYIECIHHRGVFVGVHADSPEDCLKLWNERQLQSALDENRRLKGLLEQYQEANFRQAAKISAITGARAEFADRLLEVFGYTMYTKEYEAADIVGEVTAALKESRDLRELLRECQGFVSLKRFPSLSAKIKAAVIGSTK